MKIGYTSEDRLIAKFRTPLDGKRAAMLAAVLIEYPEHEFAVEPPFLVVRTPEVGE